MDGVLEDLRKLGVKNLLPRTVNLGEQFFAKPRLILGCSADYDDDEQNI
jgi:hypothetical protein